MSNQTQYNEATQRTDADTLVEVYKDAALRTNEHLVLVGMLGAYLGLFDEGWRSMVNRVADVLGRGRDGIIPDSVVSPMRTLFDAVIPGYSLDASGFTVAGGRTRGMVLEGLCAEVDGITSPIFGEGPVQYATLKRAVQCGGVLKGAIKDDPEFPAADFLRDVLAFRQSTVKDRDYGGVQTNEMLGAVAGAIQNGAYPGITLTGEQSVKADDWAERVPKGTVEVDRDSKSRACFARVVSVLTGVHKTHDPRLPAEWADTLMGIIGNIPAEVEMSPLGFPVTGNGPGVPDGSLNA